MSTIGNGTLITPDHSLDGQSTSTQVIVALAVCSFASTLAVVLRIYTRTSILRTFGPDDIAMVVAQILTIGAAVPIGIEAHLGLGRHYWTQPQSQYIPYMKSFYASIVIYNVATCVVKMSILLQYRRIFSGPVMQKLTAIGLVFEGCWSVTLSVLLPNVCNPVSSFWDPAVPGTCLNQLAIWYVMASVNLVTDFVVFSMPLPVIKNLQLPKKQKVMLMGVFCLGFFTCAISIYRIRTLKVAADSRDPTWDNTDAAMWSFIELCIGVLAACLPTLKPLFALIVPRLFKSSVGGTSRYLSRGGGRPRSSFGGGSQFGGGGWPLKSLNKSISTAASPYGKNSTLNDSDSTEGLQLEGMDDRTGDLPIMYNVVVTGGKGNESFTDVTSPGTARGHGGHAAKLSSGGIQTTTVVTQKVERADSF